MGNPIFNPNEPRPGLNPGPGPAGPVLHPEQQVPVQHDKAAFVQKSELLNAIFGGSKNQTGIVLDKRQTSSNRQPVALMGKVFCKVDATFGAIEAGDLLTTSSTPGHAMKTSDPFKAFGAVIGKALRPLTEGQG